MAPFWLHGMLVCRWEKQISNEPSTIGGYVFHLDEKVRLNSIRDDWFTLKMTKNRKKISAIRANVDSEWR